MSDDTPHALRVIVGLVWSMALIMAGSMAYEAGFSLVESAAIAIVGPPAFFVGMTAGGWALGTLAIWLDRVLGLTRWLE